MDFNQAGNDGKLQSIVSLVREKGRLTAPAAQTLAHVVAQWARIKITIQSGKSVFVAGSANTATEVFLCVRPAVELESDFIFDIIFQSGLQIAPLEAPSDPGCSIHLLRAIAEAASLVGFGFPRTVYPAQAASCVDLTMPLLQSVKPDALSLAHSIWNKVAQQVPEVVLADHTDLDSMGSTNLGSMFKLCNVLLAQGVLRKYRLNVIPCILTMCFLVDKTLCTWVQGPAKRLGFYPRLRNWILACLRLSDTRPTTTCLRKRC